MVPVAGVGTNFEMVSVVTGAFAVVTSAHIDTVGCPVNMPPGYTRDVDTEKTNRGVHNAYHPSGVALRTPLCTTLAPSVSVPG